MTNEQRAKSAWQMGKIIQNMNNEEAYYESGWLYYWVDEADEEDAYYYFGEDEEAYLELRRKYLEVFEEYYEDGWYLESHIFHREDFKYIERTLKILGIPGKLVNTRRSLWEVVADHE